MKALLLILIFIPSICFANEHLTCWSGGEKVVNMDIRESTLNTQAWYVILIDGRHMYVRADCIIEELIQ